MLDTSTLIDIDNRIDKTIFSIKELSKTHPENAAISFITYFEYLVGIKNKSYENQQKILSKLKKYNILKADAKTAEYIAELKYSNEKKGVHIPLADLIIAAQAKEHNLILVTKDNHFKNIEEISTILIT